MMPLLNDMARCQGVDKVHSDKVSGVYFEFICTIRNHCARYIERNQGGPRTMTYAHLCCEGDDSYIPTEKPNDN